MPSQKIVYTARVLERQLRARHIFSRTNNMWVPALVTAAIVFFGSDGFYNVTSMGPICEKLLLFFVIFGAFVLGHGSGSHDTFQEVGVTMPLALEDALSEQQAVIMTDPAKAARITNARMDALAHSAVERKTTELVSASRAKTAEIEISPEKKA
jgi:hypothetical protein